jgi:hypothetical protein
MKCPSGQLPVVPWEHLMVKAILHHFFFELDDASDVPP